MVMAFKFCNELGITASQYQASLVFSSHLQFSARTSILTVYLTCTESGQEH